MGLTFLEIEVGNPADPTTMERLDFLVDSGAIYSVVPTRVLDRLGIGALSQEEFRLANGEKISRRKGVAIFRYGARIGGADVIFGEEADSTLLGTLTLEALGLALDPLRRELRPLPLDPRGVDIRPTSQPSPGASRGTSSLSKCASYEQTPSSPLARRSAAL